MKEIDEIIGYAITVKGSKYIAIGKCFEIYENKKEAQVELRRLQSSSFKIIKVRITEII